MKFRHKKREKLDITLISMIDVLFVLLLFFMVSTTFNRNTEIKVTLPEASGAKVDQPPKMVTLTIAENGAYFLKPEEGQSIQLADQTVETLKQALLKLALVSKDQPFIINADAKTQHQAVITALEAAGEAGFSHITFAALQSKAKP